MNDIKSTTAKNISALRQKAGMTQLELAEKLNYSDKAISKWEHGDSLPDITVLAEIADLFGVSIDALVRGEKPAPAKAMEKPQSGRRNKIIVFSALLLVVFLALLTFVLIRLISGGSLCPWIVFIYATPVGCIVWLVLNTLWFNKRRNYLIISLLTWSILMSIHLSLPTSADAFLVYLLGIPGQAVILLWSGLKKPKTTEK